MNAIFRAAYSIFTILVTDFSRMNKITFLLEFAESTIIVSTLFHDPFIVVCRIILWIFQDKLTFPKSCFDAIAQEFEEGKHRNVVK